MIPGRKVYDPVTNTYSTGYWVPIVDRFGHTLYYVPVWNDFIKNKEKRRKVMSLDIRHLTNGQKEIYVVVHTDTGEREIYNTREEVPQSIRHYAKEGAPKFVGPDMARLLCVQDIFYPNFPKCGHPEYLGTNCIAEACAFAEPNGYRACPHFDNSQYRRAE